MTGHAGKLRMSIWVEGVLADQQWATDAEQGRAIGDHHQQMALGADAAGKVWMVEVYDPDSPGDSGYVRFGTDPEGMVLPLPVELW
jgi:hypothetical protein